MAEGGGRSSFPTKGACMEGKDFPSLPTLTYQVLSAAGAAGMSLHSTGASTELRRFVSQHQVPAVRWGLTPASAAPRDGEGAGGPLGQVPVQPGARGWGPTELQPLCVLTTARLPETWGRAWRAGVWQTV